MIFIKNSTDFFAGRRLTPERLQELVRGAQRDVQTDIDALCYYFYPLVVKECKRSNVYNTFGNEAYSIAWIIFLSFIRRYNGCDFLNLPGLVRCHLHYELLHAVQRKGLDWDNERLSAFDEASEEAQNASADVLRQLTDNIALKQEIERLTPRQQAVLRRIYFTEEKQSHAAGCSASLISYYKKSALTALRKRGCALI